MELIFRFKILYMQTCQILNLFWFGLKILILKPVAMQRRPSSKTLGLVLD